MYVPEGLDMDEAQLREEFDRVSSDYAHSIEASFQQEEEDKSRYLDAAQAMPPPLVPEMLNTFGLTTEEIEQRNAMEEEIEREYYERKLRAQLIDTSHEDDTTPEALEDELQNVEGTQLVPYATLGVSNDMTLLEENFPDAEMHNPYAVAVKGESAQDAYVNLWGEGIGHHWATGAPDFNTSKSLFVSWWYIHVPINGAYWYVTAFLRFVGAIRCYANDKKYNSRFAGTSLRADISTRPFDITSSLHTKRKSSTLFNYAGQNLDIIRKGTWTPKFDRLWPSTRYFRKPHWIIVTVNGQCRVRGGGSNSMLNFSKGSTGSFPYALNSHRVSVNKW